MTQRFLLFCDLFFHITFERCFFYIGFFHKGLTNPNITNKSERLIGVVVFIEHRTIHLLFILLPYCCCCKRVQVLYLFFIFNFPNRSNTCIFSLFQDFSTKSQPVLLQIDTNRISIYNHKLYSWRTKKFYICCFLLSFAYFFFEIPCFYQSGLYTLFAIMISQFHASEISILLMKELHKIELE